MPIIFAQAIMFVPSFLGGSLKNVDLQFMSNLGSWMEIEFADIFGLWYNVVFGLLIIVFTYFYTAITVPTNKIADDLKRSGGFIPGIRPGESTALYIDTILTRLTTIGALYLTLVCLMPEFLISKYPIPFYLGGALSLIHI